MEVSDREKSDRDKKNKTTKQLVILVIVLFLILAIILSIGYFKNRKGGKELGNLFDISLDGNLSTGEIAKKSQDEIRDELNKQVEEGMINISMNTNPIFETGTSEGNLLIVNEEINRYPQVVEIYRDDTNELIYKSGGIPVGSRVEESTLSVDLAKGTYDCTAYFNAVNPDTSELVGKAGAKIKVTINN